MIKICRSSSERRIKVSNFTSKVSFKLLSFAHRPGLSMFIVIKSQPPRSLIVTMSQRSRRRHWIIPRCHAIVNSIVHYYAHDDKRVVMLMWSGNTVGCTSLEDWNCMVRGNWTCISLPPLTPHGHICTVPQTVICIEDTGLVLLTSCVTYRYIDSYS